MQHFDKITHLYFDLDDTLWDFKANSRIGLRCVYEVYKLDKWFRDFEDYYEMLNSIKSDADRFDK